MFGSSLEVLVRSEKDPQCAECFISPFFHGCMSTPSSLTPAEITLLAAKAFSQGPTRQHGGSQPDTVIPRVPPMPRRRLSPRRADGTTVTDAVPVRRVDETSVPSHWLVGALREMREHADTVDVLGDATGTSAEDTGPALSLPLTEPVPTSHVSPSGTSSGPVATRRI